MDLVVDQTSTGTISKSNELFSNTNARALAVVDRTADIALAASALAPTRLAPYDTSPYSPDLVIVNSFVVETFIDECLRHAENSAPKPSPTNESDSLSNLQKLVTDSETSGKLKIYASKITKLKILVLQDRYGASSLSDRIPFC